jgi:hypothetical protein
MDEVGRFLSTQPLHVLGIALGVVCLGVSVRASKANRRAHLGTVLKRPARCAITREGP